MTLFYGLVLLAGIVLAGFWLARVAIANGVDGYESADPELTWGARGRMVVAALIGFALGGFAVLYTTLPAGLSIASATVGAVALAATARWLGPPTP